VKRIIFSTIVAATLAIVPSLASAQSSPIDVAGGFMHLSDGTNAGAALVSLHGIGISLPGVHPQITLAAPLTSGGGRYALTAEGAVHVPLSHVYFGAGAGVGRLDDPLRTGVLYDAFAGAGIAPHVDVVARYYAGLNHYVGQGVFAGLSLHL
jgi:hypothetical protein